MKIIVDTKKVKEPLGDLFGLFFEDLNHAADGGLYAELVQNRAFEYDPIDNPEYDSFTAWEKIEVDGKLEWRIDKENSISEKNPHYLVINVVEVGESVGVQNIGFNTGIPFKENESYIFTCYAKRQQDFEKPLVVSFRSETGEVYTEQELIIDNEWKQYELLMKAPCNDYSGRLAITVSGAGEVSLDFVSLFPKDTFMGRRNGLRKDIGELLAAMKPKFMRFPGGCLVHCGSLNADARDSMYRWKNTIGPIIDRPARKSMWGYNQTLGLGYFEYFQFCEDIGAKAVPILPGGYNPHTCTAAPMEHMQEWIDEALDLIEFASGDKDTKWGRKRAEMGHEAPFNLEYIGIGNEETGEAFYERYAIIHRAIKDKYPDIKVINTSGPFSQGGDYDRGWQSAREEHSDLVDEHYYSSPEWFITNHHRYDSFKKEDPKVFVGEYASWGNTYYNALAEASFMIGMEKNAHAVSLACYAPMLCNIDYVGWKPDMVWFNNHQVYGSSSYYVQKLFMHHQGDYLLECIGKNMDECENWTQGEENIFGDIVLSNSNSIVQYYDITLTNDETGEIRQYDACTVDKENPRVFIDKVEWKSYSMKLKAKEIDEGQGFTIYFGKKDEKNQLSWNVGSWLNQNNTLNELINDRVSCLCQYYFSVEKGREYELELEVNGRQIKTFIDGQPFHDLYRKHIIVEPLYYSASMEEKTGDIILKVVNVSEKNRNVAIELDGMTKQPYSEVKSNEIKCTVFSMEGYSLEAENSFEQPDFISPKVEEILISDYCFEYRFLKQSITIFRIKRD